MVLKSLGKKAKNLVKGKKSDKGEAPAPTRPTVQAPAKGEVTPKAVPLHGWKGGQASGPKGEAKLGKGRGEGAAWKKADKPGKPQGPAVIGKKDEPKAANWQAGVKGPGPQGPAVLGAKRGASEQQKAPQQNQPVGYLDAPKEAPSPYLNAVPPAMRGLGALNAPVMESTAYTLQSDGTNRYQPQTIERAASDSDSSSDEWQVRREEGTSAFQHSNPDELGPEYVDSGAVSESVASSGSETESSEPVGEAMVMTSYQNAVMGPNGLVIMPPDAQAQSYTTNEGVTFYQNQGGTNFYQPPGYNPLRDAPQANHYLNTNAPAPQQQALIPGYTPPNAPLAQAPEAPQALPPGYTPLNAPQAKAPEAPQALPPGYAPLNAPQAQAPQQELPPGYAPLNAPQAQAPQQELPPGYAPLNAPQAQAPQQELPPGYAPPGQNAALGYQNQAITNAYTPPGYNPFGTTANNEAITNAYTPPGYNPMGSSQTNYSNKLFLEQSAQSKLSISTTVSSSSEELPEVKDERPITYMATKAPNVQPVTPAAQDEKVAKMQTDLRRGARYNNQDVPERRGASSIAVNRADLSKTEQKSQGWANLAIRDNYRNQRTYNGSITKGLDRDLLRNGSPTQYFITKAMKLDEEARKVLASNLKAGKGTKREDTVLKFQGGVFVDAKGEAVDTTHVQALNQAIHEHVDKLTTKMADARSQGLAAKLQKLAGQLDELNSVNQQAAARKAGIAGRYIYVMNSAGEFFAGQSVNGVVHHSSFLAGGAVAGAGEIAISGGKLTAISNTSGHYRPGPAYLWQTVKQLEMLGVPLESVRVDVMGVSKPFKNAAEFLGAFNPSEDPEMFDAAKAIAHLKAYLDKKSFDKKLEREALEQAEDVRAEGADGSKKPKQ